MVDWLNVVLVFVVILVKFVVVVFEVVVLEELVAELFKLDQSLEPVNFQNCTLLGLYVVNHI